MNKFRLMSHCATFLIVNMLLCAGGLQAQNKHGDYISHAELQEIANNKNEKYVYLGKHFSDLYDVIERINELDDNTSSVTRDLQDHIDSGFSIGLYHSVIEALKYAGDVFHKNAYKIDTDDAQDLGNALEGVIDQVVNEALSINPTEFTGAEAGQTKECCPHFSYGVDSSDCRDCTIITEDNRIILPCPVKIKKGLKVFGKAEFREDVIFKDDVCFKDKVCFTDKVKFKQDVTFQDEVIFEDDVTIEETLTVTDLVVLSCLDTLCVNTLTVIDIIIPIGSCIENLCVQTLSVTDIVILSCVDNLCVTNLSVTDITVLSCIDSLCVTDLSVTDESVSGTLSATDAVIGTATITDLTVLSCMDSLCVNNLSVGEIIITSCIDSLCVIDLSAVDASISGTLSAADAVIGTATIGTATITDLTVLSCMDSLCVNNLSVGEIIVSSCIDSLCVIDLSVVDESVSGTLSATDAVIGTATITDLTVLSCMDSLCVNNLSVGEIIVSSCIDTLCVNNLSVGELVVASCIDNLCVIDLSVVDADISGTLSVNNEVVANLSVLNCMDFLCVIDLSAVDVSISGTLSVSEIVTEAISTCDVIVGCNILMNNTISPLIGNILKGGNRFIHNAGTDNTFVGINAGNFATTGAENVGVGRNALFSNTTGFENNAIGGFALVTNTTGSGNTAVGFDSGFSLATGNNNVFLGNNAALFLATGFTNVIIGFNSGLSLTSGDNNIYIANPGVVSESGIIRIGTTATHTSTFIQGIFGSVVGGTGLPVFIDAAGQLGTVVSSRRFKHDIQELRPNVSESIYNLRPVSFVYNADESKTQQYGLIAEEVDQVFPELVIRDEEGAPYTVRYHLLPLLLLTEVQKLNNIVRDQGSVIKRLKLDNKHFAEMMQIVMEKLNVLSA